MLAVCSFKTHFCVGFATFCLALILWISVVSGMAFFILNVFLVVLRYFLEYFESLV